jgi:uncharacterized protein (UPF0548 family)
MFHLTKPSVSLLDDILRKQSALSPTYPEVGLTSDGKYPATGYNVHTAERCLGEGVETFERAASAMRAWKNFNIGWISLYPAVPSIAEGTNLVVCAHHAVIWSVNACRIIYVIAEDSPDSKRFGFGYGTLPLHSEQGEERFLLSWDAKSDQVIYKITAFSRPNSLLVRLGWPVATKIQNQFRLDSVAALNKSLKTD